MFKATVCQDLDITNTDIRTFDISFCTNNFTVLCCQCEIVSSIIHSEFSK